jgi:hypothetical protein
MKRIFFALLAIGGFGLSNPASAQTTTQYPFCIQGVDNPGWTGCSFDSFQECEAAASGLEAECLANPWYNAGNNGASDPAANPPDANGPIPVGPPPKF